MLATGKVFATSNSTTARFGTTIGDILFFEGSISLFNILLRINTYKRNVSNECREYWAGNEAEDVSAVSALLVYLSIRFGVICDSSAVSTERIQFVSRKQHFMYLSLLMNPPLKR